MTVEEYTDFAHGTDADGECLVCGGDAEYCSVCSGIPSLEELEAEDDGGIRPPVPFTIDSMERADWYLRKLANIAEEKGRIRAHSQKLLDELTKGEERLTLRFGAELEQWAREELVRKGGRKKTLTTMQATLAFRTVPASLKVADTEAAFEEARTVLPDAIVTRVELDKAAYRKFAVERFGETGELLPGIERSEARESLNISYDGAKRAAESEATDA